MREQLKKTPLRWLIAALALLLLAACGQTPVGDGDGGAEANTLSVSVVGDGTVTSDVGDINCTSAGGDTCTATFATATDVTLTATPMTAGEPVTWSGAVTGSETTKTVNVNGTTNVTATFGTTDGGTNNYSTEFRRAYSFDHATGAAPQLTVVYTPAAGGADVTVTSSVAASANDAEELINASSGNPTAFPAGHTYVDSTDVELGFDPAHGPQVVGLLFQNVDVPADATIVSANITFTAIGDGTANDVTVNIEGQADVNAAAFADDPDGTASNDITTRSTVPATQQWVITGGWTADAKVNSPDLSAIVTEIIRQTGWSNTANGMAFIISPQPLP